MDDIEIIATGSATEAGLATARFGPRFGRLDLLSQLAVLAVESLGIDFSAMPPERIGICLAVRAGSLSTDVEYWKGRDAAGGPSPMLFTYTLPSSAIGEIAIRYRLTGPNLCFIGDEALALAEARALIRSREVDACLCLFCEALTPPAAEMISAPPSST
ncbi:MAG TPA: beta-ketoacyl synthase N-terminal-like domain-containing protein, partial [Methylomirabilota bacterium]|nr:beta-ketoacyl synthase N-terminal-like domain-containing protein [Methylomirabilota bacterium]